MSHYECKTGCECCFMLGSCMFCATHFIKHKIMTWTQPMFRIPTDKLPVTSPLALRALSVTFSEECSRRAESCYEEKNEQNSWLNQSINLYIHLFLSICHLSLSVCLSVSVCLLLPLWSGFPGHREGTGSLIHPPVSAHLHWLAGIPCLPDNTESFLNISVTSCNITQC